MLEVFINEPVKIASVYQYTVYVYQNVYGAVYSCTLFCNFTGTERRGI